MKMERLFLYSAVKHFAAYKKLGDKSISQLSDAEMHFQPNKESNSIAIIIQHLHGNMKSRWTNFLTEDGEKPWRKRDKEFEPQNLSKEDLLKLWDEGWKILLTSLSALKDEDCFKSITIRHEPHSVVDAITRQMAPVFRI